MGRGATGLSEEQALRIETGREAISRQHFAAPAARNIQGAVASLFSGFLGGRGEVQTRTREANEALVHLSATYMKYDGIIRKANAEEEAGNTVQATAIRGTDEHREALEKISEAEARQEKAEARLGSVGRSAVRNLASIAAGLTVYQVGLQAVQVVQSAMMPAGEAFIDQLAGFQGLTTKVTSALAETTRTFHGYSAGAIAAASETAGLS